MFSSQAVCLELAAVVVWGSLVTSDPSVVCGLPGDKVTGVEGLLDGEVCIGVGSLCCSLCLCLVPCFGCCLIACCV